MFKASPSHQGHKRCKVHQSYLLRIGEYGVSFQGAHLHSTIYIPGELNSTQFQRTISEHSLIYNAIVMPFLITLKDLCYLNANIEFQFKIPAIKLLQ